MTFQVAENVVDYLNIVCGKNLTKAFGFERNAFRLGASWAGWTGGGLKVQFV